MTPQLLIVETSDRVGRIALAAGATILVERRLDETRRHARDLAPSVAELLRAHNWTPRDLSGVLVSRGPGSFTGLRVGIMSAKALAYAAGCALLGIDTFAAIAAQAGDFDLVDVLADAQQDKVYVQRFTRSAGEWQPCAALAIRAFAEWMVDRDAAAPVTGPGLRKWAGRLPGEVRRIDEAEWDPRPESLLRLGLARLQAGERDDPFALEPLYLRPSSAEEQWAARIGADASAKRR